MDPINTTKYRTHKNTESRSFKSGVLSCQKTSTVQIEHQGVQQAKTKEQHVKAKGAYLFMTKPIYRPRHSLAGAFTYAPDLMECSKQAILPSNLQMSITKLSYAVAHSC